MLTCIHSPFSLSFPYIYLVHDGTDEADADSIGGTEDDKNKDFTDDDSIGDTEGDKNKGNTLALLHTQCYSMFPISHLCMQFHSHALPQIVHTTMVHFYTIAIAHYKVCHELAQTS